MSDTKTEWVSHFIYDFNLRKGVLEGALIATYKGERVTGFRLSKPFVSRSDAKRFPYLITISGKEQLVARSAKIQYRPAESEDT